MNGLCFGEQVPRLMYEVIDRPELDLPEWYLRHSQGALIAGENILKAAGYRARSHQPYGWKKIHRFKFERVSDDGQRILLVRGCGDFWTVERLQTGDGRTMPFYDAYALVCAFSCRPIWAHRRQAAMRLAEYCDPMPRPSVAHYSR
jgi:hypothetical protein